ncbi:uncharacterized protein [Misgurnus anguillicaudatus]|uniref:uncharacterized protein n=1 Tax=Misgurnus anguillicaudatus TaxID=75329 RepID=UPI003CCF4845
MASYRKKLKQLGCPELSVNTSTHSRYAVVKKPHKAELNYLPPHPEGQTAESLEQICEELLGDVYIRDNLRVVNEKMATTFSIRRQEIVKESLAVDVLMLRWPALFHVTQIKEEFKRLTAVDLESTFIGNLDKVMANLLGLFHAKGGIAGYKIRETMKLLDQDHGVDIRREVVIRCLIVYLSENIEDLIEHYQDTTAVEDIAEHSLKIITRGGAPDGTPFDAEIVLDGIRVLGGLSSLMSPCISLFGLIYSLDLCYPKGLKYTFEFFQKVLLNLVQNCHQRFYH